MTFLPASKGQLRGWTRDLAALRTKVAKRQKEPSERATSLDTTRALEICEGLVNELGSQQIECEALGAELRRTRAMWQRVFDLLPTACIMTDTAGTIVSANGAAARLLNTSVRALPGRPLLIFTENRLMFARLIAHTQVTADPIAADLPIRPRERRPLVMTAAVARLEPDATEVLWFLTASSPTRTLNPFRPADDAAAADSSAEAHG